MEPNGRFQEVDLESGVTKGVDRSAPLPQPLVTAKADHLLPSSLKCVYQEVSPLEFSGINS